MEESVKRSAEQRTDSIRAHLNENDVVRLYVNFGNWLQACRTSARLFHVRWLQDDAARELTGVPITRVAELMTQFRSDDIDGLEQWDWEAVLDQSESSEPSSTKTATPIGEGEEFLYVLTNDSMPEFIKIGRTENDPADRARQLSSFTGVPTAFRVYRSYNVRDSLEAEQRVHERLNEYRVAANREFFRIDPDAAAEVIELMLSANATPRENPEEEDQRFTEALQLVLRKRSVSPSMLRGYLKITYEQAEQCINKMKALGVLDDEWNVHPGWQPTRGAPLTEHEQKEEVANRAYEAEVDARRLEVKARDRKLPPMFEQNGESSGISTEQNDKQYGRIALLFVLVFLLVVVWIKALSPQ